MAGVLKTKETNPPVISASQTKRPAVKPQKAAKVSKRAKQVRQYLAIPAEKDWELWSFPPSSPPKLDRTLTLQELNTVPNNTRIALPNRHIVSLALWLNTTDTSLFREMILVQLEKRGLTKNAGDKLNFHFHVVEQHEQRTLITVFLPSPDLPKDYCLEMTSDYDFSARCRALPGEGFTLWKEEGRLVLAVTRQSQIVALHTFCGKIITPELVREILCLYLQLSWERIVGEQSLLFYLWGSFLPDEMQALKDVLQAIPQHSLVPNPVFVNSPLQFTPERVILSRGRQDQELRWQRTLGQIIWTYLLVLIAIVGYLTWMAWQANQLRNQVKLNAPMVQQIKDTAARWNTLRPAIDPSSYPIEILLSAVKQLPNETRLTKMESSPGKILFMGEAKDAQSAFTFLKNLQTEPSLKGWTWNMPQPQLLPSNRAQFQLEGSHGGAATQ